MTVREALNTAMDEEMARDETVFILGEEVAKYNGAYKVCHKCWLRTEKTAADNSYAMFIRSQKVYSISMERSALSTLPLRRWASLVSQSVQHSLVFDQCQYHHSIPLRNPVLHISLSNPFASSCEFMTFNFAMQAIDQIVNSAAKTYYMSGGNVPCPVVFRGPNGAAAGVAAQHSQDFAAWYGSIPGLKVVSPYSSEDCKGLLKVCTRSAPPLSNSD